MARRSGANLNLEIDMTPLLHGVQVLDDRLDRGVHGVFEYYDSNIESWMKTNAPWTDRTGAARSGLSVVAEHEPKVSHALHMFYRVPYGIWLEVRFAGRYSVIVPALVHFGPKLMGTLNKLFARLRAA